MELRLYQKSNRYEISEAMPKILSYILTTKSSSGIMTVKKIRDDSVATGFASYLECDVPNIKKKEELFSLYLDTRDEVCKSNNNKPADSYLSTLNEFWGMWLLIDFDEKVSIVDLKCKLREDLKTARQKIGRRESPSSNLHHYTAFGNELREKGHLAESIRMYTKAIQKDHCWAAIAYYNKAFASLTQQERHQPKCISQALEDLQNALKSVELYCEQIEVTQRYFKQVKDLESNSVSRFDKHITTRHKVLLCFKENIDEAMKNLRCARDSGGDVKLNKKSVYFLFSSKHFLPMILPAFQSLPLIWTRDPVMILQLITDPSFDIPFELQSLKSLGLTHIYTLDTLSFWYSPFLRIRSALHRGFERIMRGFMRLFK